MTPLRHFLLHHRLLAFWLVGAALAMRIVVPAGYMPYFSGNSVSIEICSGSMPMQAMTMVIPGVMPGVMPGMPDHHDGKGDPGKGEMPCGFSGLTAPAVAGADPVLLALAIVFIVSTVFRSAPPRRVALPTYLRPPLRGPPVLV